MKTTWLLNATTAEVTVPPIDFRLNFSVTNESARLAPSRRLLEGELITIHIRTGADWTPIASMSSTENPGGILLMAYGNYGATKSATVVALGVYVDRI